jgi:alanine racemase
VLMGIGGDAEISLDDVARWAGTISYEVLCGISKRVPRTYFRRGKVEAFKSLLGVIPNHVSV